MSEFIPGGNYGGPSLSAEDLESRRRQTMKKLVDGKYPNLEPKKAYDLAGNIIENEEMTDGKNEISPEDIKAITKNIRLKSDIVLAKESLYQSQGKSGDEVERLLDLIKQDIMSEIGVTEEMYTIDDDDDFKIREGKIALKDAISEFNRIGKLAI